LLLSVATHAKLTGFERGSGNYSPVTADDIEELFFGVDGEAPAYRVRRAGDLFVVYGQTGAGGLVAVVGEIVGKSFRAYGVRELTAAEAHAFRSAGT
jgi:hypothetical protein